MPTETEPTVQEMEKAPVKAEEPSGTEVEVAEAFEVTPRPSTQLAQATLPKTGSMLPLIGLMGLLLVSAGTVLRTFAKRSA